MFQAKLQKELLGQLAVHAGHRVLGEQRERNAWRYFLARRCRESQGTKRTPCSHPPSPGRRTAPACPTSARGPLLLKLTQNGYKLPRIAHIFKNTPRYKSHAVGTQANTLNHFVAWYRLVYRLFVRFLHSTTPYSYSAACPQAAGDAGSKQFPRDQNKAANVMTPPPTRAGQKKRKENECEE